MGIIRSGWEDIKRVVRVLDKRTKRILIVMAIFTVTISGLMFKVFDNPVIDAWREDRDTEQVLKEREERLEKEREEREIRKEERDLNKEENESEGVVF